MTAQTNEHGRVTAIALMVLAGLALAAALYISRGVSAPVIVAFVAVVVLAPVHDRLCRLGLGQSLSAALIMLVLALGGFAAAFVAEPLLGRVTDEIPRLRWELRSLINDVRYYLQGIEEINQDIQRAVDADGNADSGDGEASEQNGPTLPSALDAVLLAPRILGQIVIFVGTLFFGLTCRRQVYDFMAHKFAKTETDRMRDRIDRAEKHVATYFGTIALVNAGLGAALAAGLMVIGLPLAIAWGLGAALLNFILYLGPAVVAIALLLAGLLNFEGALVFAPAGLFLVLNMIEAQFVTPTLVGRNVRLSPLLVFLAIVFWLWLWGPIGGIVAIPMLVFVLSLMGDPAFRPEPVEEAARAGDLETPV